MLTRGRCDGRLVAWRYQFRSETAANIAILGKVASPLARITNSIANHLPDRPLAETAYEQAQDGGNWLVKKGIEAGLRLRGSTEEEIQRTLDMLDKQAAADREKDRMGGSTDFASTWAAEFHRQANRGKPLARLPRVVPPRKLPGKP